MRLNKFKVSTVLYFKSGVSKKVDWIEENLVKRIEDDSSETTTSVTIEEADRFFQGKFLEWKKNEEVICKKNAKGETSMIPFKDVEYATVSVSQITEQEEIDMDSKESIDTPLTERDFGWSRQTRSSAIENHPAYKK
ncbi:hypothetical protein MOD67_14300 [Bacillus licheniformis]|uniref:hypothetical protein n=1 Tax=Bacillus TaxID=1386 RepID=UPI00228084D5|nr:MULTISPECIES: hypothetical protein [Bacillus]MCY7861195.1 hypothetical protein [Bacillus haynesii]MCY8015477.1 hypothetical protein [Bacillus haynesii]MCY8291476.1 hypothetical protein [Bacillus haynesii]MCY8549099.1 hypothetical protein [Bacillus haynesii]MCY8745152.1 hypothetical protein [Bacillus licheniformis]